MPGISDEGTREDNASFENGAPSKLRRDEESMTKQKGTQ